ncbi:DUF1674-domain-containing protein [Xylariaceae sp. FL0804]|nr:DUF1674-domain-containing protein [Xylariaceae sp. FL0804]
MPSTHLRLAPSATRRALRASTTSTTRPSLTPRAVVQLLAPTTRHASSFEPGPAPPRLPPDQQAEFERLQRTANTQEGFNARATPASLDDDAPSSSSSTTTTTTTPAPATMTTTTAAADQAADQQMSTPLRKGAPPEFAGDVNPRTGEVGGPKNEPLRWGAAGDYSYNGRVTDF